MTIRLLSVLLAVLGVAGIAAAQTTPVPTGPTWQFEWDQPVGSGQTITQYQHFIVVDTAAPVALTRTCGTTAGPEGFVCRATVPAMTPGVHTLRLIARAVINGTPFEAPADPQNRDRLVVNLVVAVSPTSLRVIAPVQP